MIAGLNGWDLTAIVTAVALIVVAVRTGRSTQADAPAPVEPVAEEFPTTPIPRIPAAPETRLMLRRDELLWCKSGEDPEGVITLGLRSEPAGQLGVLMDDNGIAIGVRLDRFEVQGLRDALTVHLVASSKPVRP